MANALGELFGDIANAIRSKTGDTGTIKPAEFPAKIVAIETGGDTGGSGGNGDIEYVDGVDPYYQKLAEAVMMRDAKYLTGDETVLNMKGFKLSNGNTLGSLAGYSFAGFNYVEGMAFTDVILIEANTFEGDEKLKILDITVTKPLPQIAMYPNALSGCSVLEAVIVRNGANGLTSVSIAAANGANDTFYVYVPSAYYDTVVSALSVSAVPADRFRKLEDYPEIDNWNKTYKVNFYDGYTLVDTKYVKYGESATTSYRKEGYTLIEWSPSPTNVTSNMNCYGSWEPSSV